MADAASLQELRRRNAELAEAVAARDAFIAVAAHELRNPMTPIIGQIELLLAALKAGKYTPEQIEHRLDRIRRLMNHYLKRASTILDVSRITTGKLRLDTEPCDLCAVVREVVGSFAETARYGGSPIRLDVPACLSGSWDPLAMEQIIDNLLSNAIRYGGRKPVEMTVELQDAKVRIRVRDHGEGISVADRARIFQPFERAVGHGERHSGFGVGLWVVGQLVEAMQGEITVEDAPGGGALFTVILPQHAAATSP